MALLGAERAEPWGPATKLEPLLCIIECALGRLTATTLSCTVYGMARFNFVDKYESAYGAFAVCRRPTVEYIRDVYAELMAMGEGKRRPGDRSDISSDEEDDMEVKQGLE